MRKTLLTAAALLLSAANLFAYTIDDNYIGADPTHNYAHVDVIGQDKYYNIDGMNVASAGTKLKVDIYSSFVSQTSSSTIWNDKTHIGDLFIGTGGWSPYGTAPYKEDNASNTGTKWDYVAVFDKHVPMSSGDTTKTGNVKIFSTKDGDFIKSNLGGLNPNQWIYRADQIVQFTPKTDAVALATGTWGIVDNALTKTGITYGDLWLSFDYSGIKATGQDWAFHWAMTCGNDVIEGQTRVPPVPEPGTMALLGLGLAGFGLARRRLLR